MNDTTHEFDDRAYVRKWAETADQRRPQRPTVFRHIAALIAQLGSHRPHVLELGCGPGALAYVLLETIDGLDYEGIDYSPPMLELARERLARFGDRARLREADLRDDAWLRDVARALDAVVTNQALHDLGTGEAVGTTYERARTLLRPGGLFVNAELVIPDGSASEKPGKLPVAVHLERLRAAGFVDVRAELDYGDYVCLVGRAPAVSA